MVPLPDKYQSREIRRTIRDLLNTEWDPIGVRGTSGSEGEYDEVVGSVYFLLTREDVSAELIAAHLTDAATGLLGLQRTAFIEESSAHAASKLMELRPQFQVH
jgi:hypothetical protein